MHPSVGFPRVRKGTVAMVCAVCNVILKYFDNKKEAGSLRAPFKLLPSRKWTVDENNHRTRVTACGAYDENSHCCAGLPGVGTVFFSLQNI